MAAGDLRREDHKVSMDKLVAVDQVTRRFVPDVYYARHDPGYQWYYQSSMGPDESVLFRSWDTVEDEK